MTLLNSRVVRVSTASLLTGLLVGGVGGAFRLLLIKADDLRDQIVLWAHSWPYGGRLVPVAVCLVGATLARLLVVRFAPHAEGSGVQRVEALFNMLLGSEPIYETLKRRMIEQQTGAKKNTELRAMTSSE